MRVLVACEFSGVVREAFRARGHDAWSCDLLPALDKSPFHIRDNVLQHLEDGWDLMIAHPPCTYLTCAGNRWFAEDPSRYDRQEEALVFVAQLLLAPIARIALENPIGVISTKIRKPDQIIQPHYFGHADRKSTCLWLKGLPKLKHTSYVSPLIRDEHFSNHDYIISSFKKTRHLLRSITFKGIAEAMAQQWGSLP